MGSRSTNTPNGGNQQRRLFLISSGPPAPPAYNAMYRPQPSWYNNNNVGGRLPAPRGLISPQLPQFGGSWSNYNVQRGAGMSRPMRPPMGYLSSVYPGSETVNAFAANMMSYYYNNQGPPTSCGPSTSDALCTTGDGQESYSNVVPGVFSAGPGCQSQIPEGNESVPLDISSRIQSPRDHRLKPGYRIINDASVTHFLCAVCCKKDARLCTGCGHVAYCGTKCQRLDWGRHKYDCLPATIVDKSITLRLGQKDAKPDCSEEISDPKVETVETKPYNGKLLARRLIKRGETIVNFQPLMMACNVKGLIHPPDSILCLTCCKFYQSSQGYRCSSCSWPVCSLQCEEDPIHSQNECPIFFKNNVPPTAPSEHSQFFDDAILALRCLLLKSHDPPKFQELFEWTDICLQKNKTPTWAEYDKKIYHFLTKRCRILDLIDIDEDTFLQYLTVIDACSILLRDRIVVHADETAKYFYSAKYVFPIRMSITEECTPNSKWSILHSPKLEGCSLRLHACIDIERGNYVTASFSGIGDFGASFIDRYNNERFQESCDCRRCKDPTELGSFFSGVRCQECENETNGYLLPLDPSNKLTEWECRNESCKKRLNGSYIMKDINRIYSEMVATGRDYWVLVNLIWKYERQRLHPNHFLILMAATTCVSLFWGSVRGHPFYSPRYDFFTSTINLANRSLDILDIVAPGASIQRARVMFQLQVALSYKNLRDFRRNMEWFGMKQQNRCVSRVFWEVQKIQEETYAILTTEPYGSVEHELAIVLQEVIEDQIDLLCLTPIDVPLDCPSIYNLHKIYTRFSNEYYYPAIPIYEDKDINDFVISTGPCARHMVEKLNYTI